jgi:hypothetical protein
MLQIFKAMVAHTTIISSDGKEALAPSAAPPRDYPRNATSVRKMPVHPPQATGGHNSLTEETKSFKPAEERKEGEQTKGSQCKGWRPPFQESGQGNRTVDQKIHAKAIEGGGREKKGDEYQEQLHMKETLSLSFDPTHDISGEGGAQVISLIDDASWEVIDYPNSGPT